MCKLIACTPSSDIEENVRAQPRSCALEQLQHIRGLLSEQGRRLYLQDWEGHVRAWFRIQSYRMGRFCFHWSYLSFSSFFSLARGAIISLYVGWVHHVCLSDRSMKSRRLLVRLFQASNRRFGSNSGLDAQKGHFLWCLQVKFPLEGDGCLSLSCRLTL